eukprot:TRINITY_DN4798_c0_g1_i4.p1 TRINITY_DN4798_c0_g1~~TRINITY_DN4798_c0_g1_i4.p1  ORF type:complete len:240 (-),score=48.66 TRINITY_DN4798_c0_g1_i4:226-870(-)
MCIRDRYQRRVHGETEYSNCISLSKLSMKLVLILFAALVASAICEGFAAEDLGYFPRRPLQELSSFQTDNFTIFGTAYGYHVWMTYKGLKLRVNSADYGALNVEYRGDEAWYVCTTSNALFVTFKASNQDAAKAIASALEQVSGGESKYINVQYSDRFVQLVFVFRDMPSSWQSVSGSEHKYTYSVVRDSESVSVELDGVVAYFARLISKPSKD